MKATGEEEEGGGGKGGRIGVGVKNEEGYH
jgi:hypothetical protein